MSSGLRMMGSVAASWPGSGGGSSVGSEAVGAVLTRQRETQTGKSGVEVAVNGNEQ
jgi:hypothetical protein